MTRKGPRRLEIERRLALFHANRPRVIALELGCSVSWVNDVSLTVLDEMRRKRAQEKRDELGAMGEKRPAQIDVGKEFDGTDTQGA